MKFCEGCKFNLQQKIAQFEDRPIKMFKAGCRNKVSLSDHCIDKSCLELVAEMIIKEDADLYLDLLRDELKDN